MCSRGSAFLVAGAGNREVARCDGGDISWQAQAQYFAHKSVLQECPVRVPHKSVPQECPATVSHKSVSQELRVSHKSVL